MLDVLLHIESRIYREGLALLLSRRSDIGRVVACGESASIREVCRDKPFDAILVDVSIGPNGGDPSSPIADAYREANGVPIVAFGFDAADADSAVLSLIESGAAAYVSKDDSIDDLVDTIRSVSRGEPQLSPHMVRLMQERLAQLTCLRREEAQGLKKLSQRERHIVDLVGQRLSNKLIARSLGLEVSTIKNHIHNIIVKLGVKNRAEAAARVFTAAP